MADRRLGLALILVHNNFILGASMTVGLGWGRFGQAMMGCILTAMIGCWLWAVGVAGYGYGIGWL